MKIIQYIANSNNMTEWVQLLSILTQNRITLVSEENIQYCDPWVIKVP